MTKPATRQQRPAVPVWATPEIRSFRRHLVVVPRSPLTIARYCDAASWLAGWLTAEPGVTQWSDVTEDKVVDFFVHLQTAGYSQKYISNIGGSLLQFFTWWAAEEDQPSPFATIRPPAAPALGATPPTVLAAEQIRSLIKDAETVPKNATKMRMFEARRDTALLRTFAATGGRLSEIANLPALTDEQVDAREFTVLGKGGRTRTLKVDTKAAYALDRYLRVRARHPLAHSPKMWLPVKGDSPLTSSGVRQMIERRGDRLGLNLWPHLFRHTFCHNWLDAGGEEGDLLELAGFSAQMLRVYGRSAAGARARRAYDRVDVMRGI